MTWIFISHFLALNMAFAMMPVANLKERPCSDIENVNFIPADDGLRSLNFSLAIGLAAPKIVVHDGAGHVRTCAATLISDKGHMLTAGHCLEACLNVAGVYTSDQDENPLLNAAKLASTVCRVDVNGVPTKAKVLATNRGPFDKTWVEKNVKCTGVDYAILQIQPVPANDAVSCLAPSKVAAVPGTSVSALSYPPQTSRRSSQHSATDVTDEAQYMSSGQVIEPRTTCDLKSDTNPGWHDISSPDITLQLMDKVHSGVLLQTSVDTIPGVSGAGLFKTATGEIAGVASVSGRAAVQSPSSECSGSTFYASMPKVIEDIRMNYPDLDLGSIFSCPVSKRPR